MILKCDVSIVLQKIQNIPPKEDTNTNRYAPQDSFNFITLVVFRKKRTARRKS